MFRYLRVIVLALLEQDNFNQLGSALSAKQVTTLLSRHWGVKSKQDCILAVDRCLTTLGCGSKSESAAFNAWVARERIHSDAFDALAGTCRFLVVEVGLVHLKDIGPEHLTLMACDIQQVAYLSRLGYTAGYLPREQALDILIHLKRQAQLHHDSWKDFSLSALIGMGVRCRLDTFDPGNWREISRSHRTLMAAESGILARATPWPGKPPLAPARTLSNDLLAIALALD